MTDYPTVSIRVTAKLLGLPLGTIRGLVRTGDLEMTPDGWITKASICAYQQRIYKGRANRATAEPSNNENEVAS